MGFHLRSVTIRLTRNFRQFNEVPIGISEGICKVRRKDYNHTESFAISIITLSDSPILILVNLFFPSRVKYFSYSKYLPGQLNSQAKKEYKTAKDRCSWKLNQPTFNGCKQSWAQQSVSGCIMSAFHSYTIGVGFVPA